MLLMKDSLLENLQQMTILQNLGKHIYNTGIHRDSTLKLDRNLPIKSEVSAILIKLLKEKFKFRWEGVGVI